MHGCAGSPPLAEAAAPHRKITMNTDIRLNRTLLCLIGVQVCINGCMAGIRMAAPLLSLRQG